jgi:hypothetical protein
LLVFSCVFTVFSLQKHILLVHITYIYYYTHVPYILHEMHSFVSVFMCFYYVFTAETCTFCTFYMFIPKYTCTIYSTWNAQFCYCFHVFSLSFHCRNMYFWYISHVYQNTHVPYIIHEMHSFAIVFLCFHCLFNAEKCIFGKFHMFTKIHMYHKLYMKWRVLLVFSCVFTVLSLQKLVLKVHFTCKAKYTWTIYYTWNAQFC